MGNKTINLKSILSEVFDAEKDSISLDTDHTNLRGWDSLSHIKLIVKLEEALDTELDAKEVSRVTSVKRILELLRKNEVAPESEDLLRGYKES